MIVKVVTDVGAANRTNKDILVALLIAMDRTFGVGRPLRSDAGFKHVIIIIPIAPNIDANDGRNPSLLPNVECRSSVTQVIEKIL